MKRLAAWLLIACAPALLAAPPAENLAVDFSQGLAPAKLPIPEKRVAQYSTKTYQVTLTSNGRTWDATGYGLAAYWATSNNAPSVIPATCAWTTQTTGVGTVTFSSTNLSYAAGRYVWGVGVTNTATGASSIAGQGVFVLLADPYAAGGTNAVFTAVTNLASYTASTTNWTGPAQTNIVDFSKEEADALKVYKGSHKRYKIVYKSDSQPWKDGAGYSPVMYFYSSPTGQVCMAYCVWDVASNGTAYATFSGTDLNTTTGIYTYGVGIVSNMQPAIAAHGRFEVVADPYGQGASAASFTNGAWGQLKAHTDATGTNVHGLGALSIKSTISSNDVDAATDAAYRGLGVESDPIWVAASTNYVNKTENQAAIGTGTTTGGGSLGVGVGVTVGEYSLGVGTATAGSYAAAIGPSVTVGSYSLGVGQGLTAGNYSVVLGGNLTATDNEFIWGSGTAGHGAYTATFGATELYAGTNRLVRANELGDMAYQSDYTNAVDGALRKGSQWSKLTAADVSAAGGLTNASAFDPSGSAAAVSNALAAGAAAGLSYTGTVNSIVLNGATNTPDAGGQIDLGTISGGGDVTSVNGSTGAVVITAASIGAVATNDALYLGAAQASVVATQVWSAAQIPTTLTNMAVIRANTNNATGLIIQDSGTAVAFQVTTNVRTIFGAAGAAYVKTDFDTGRAVGHIGGLTGTLSTAVSIPSTSIPVTSVNGLTGAVSVTTTSISAATAAQGIAATNAQALITNMFAITKDPSGFAVANLDDVGTFNINTNTRVVSLTNATAMPVYRDGVLLQNGTNYSWTIGTNRGLWYLKWNQSDGITNASQSLWSLSDIQAATVYWSGGTTGSALIGEETHGLMPWNVHQRFHLDPKMGAAYVSGLTIVATNNTFTMATGAWMDEDILHTISSQQTNCIVANRDGTTGYLNWAGPRTQWYRTNAANGYLQYDLNGTLTDMDAAGLATYMSMWFYAVPFEGADVMTIVGQSQDTLANIRLEQPPDLSSLCPASEAVLLCRVILRYRTAEYIETTDYRRSNVTGSSGGVQYHATLAGRSVADQHPASAISVASPVTNYTDAARTVESALSGIDAKLGTITGGSGSQTPLTNTINAAGYSITNASDGSYTGTLATTSYVDARKITEFVYATCGAGTATQAFSAAVSTPIIWNTEIADANNVLASSNFTFGVGYVGFAATYRMVVGAQKRVGLTLLQNGVVVAGGAVIPADDAFVPQATLWFPRWNNTSSTNVFSIAMTQNDTSMKSNSPSIGCWVQAWRWRDQ